MLPRDLGRVAEALEHVFKLFCPRAAPRLAPKNAVPFYVPMDQGTPFVYIAHNNMRKGDS